MKRRSFILGLIAAFCFPGPAKTLPAGTLPDVPLKTGIADTHVGFPSRIKYVDGRTIHSILCVPQKVIESRWVYPLHLRGEQVNSPREFALYHFEGLLEANSDIESVSIKDGHFFFTQYQGSKDWWTTSDKEHAWLT